MDSTVWIEPAPYFVDEPTRRPYTDALKRYLIERGYAHLSVKTRGWSRGASVGSARVSRLAEQLNNLIMP